MRLSLKKLSSWTRDLLWRTPIWQLAYYNLNQNALAADQIRQAFELADRQTVRDRLHITTLYYDLATGDVKKAIASYKEWFGSIRATTLQREFVLGYFLVGDYDRLLR